MKLFAILGLVVFGASAYAAPKVEEISGGQVKAKRGIQELALKKGDTLQAGDELRTGEGSSIDLRFDDKTLVRVGAKSIYAVGEKGKAWSPLASFLTEGAVRVLVPGKASEKPSIKFRMGTPAGTIGVRGTEFTAVHRSDETSMNTLHGEVLVGPKGADFSDLSKFSLVLAGFKAIIEAGDSNPKIEKFPLLDFVKMLDGKSDSNPFQALAWRRAGGKAGYGKHEPVKAPKNLPVQFKAPVAQKKSADSKPGELSEQVQQLTAELIAAVKSQDIDAVEEIVNKLGGAQIFRTASGDTLLHVAAVYGALQVVQFAIDEGVKVDSMNTKGQTALILVAQQTGNVDMAMLLLQNNAKLHLEEDRKSVV